MGMRGIFLNWREDCSVPQNPWGSRARWAAIVDISVLVITNICIFISLITAGIFSGVVALVEYGDSEATIRINFGDVIVPKKKISEMTKEEREAVIKLMGPMARSFWTAAGILAVASLLQLYPVIKLFCSRRQNGINHVQAGKMGRTWRNFNFIAAAVFVAGIVVQIFYWSWLVLVPILLLAAKLPTLYIVQKYIMEADGIVRMKALELPSAVSQTK